MKKYLTKSLIAYIILGLLPIYINAQSELRLGFLTTPNDKGNYGLHLEYAVPIGKYLEVTPSVLAMRNNRIDTYSPYECLTGEPYLISKQRYALHQTINVGSMAAGMLGLAVKPFAKFFKRHDIAIGGNVVYGYSKYSYEYKTENEDGIFIASPYKSEGEGFSGAVIVQLRYAYKVSNHSILGFRYMNEPTFYNWAGICSVYYGYRF